MSVLFEAKRVLENEAKAIMDLIPRLGNEFERAIEILLSCQGKVVTSGMGKSGHIARKLSSTFSSTGTPSVYVHPAESSHGDLGIISETDVVIIISNSGSSPELKDLLAYTSRKGIPLIAMVGNMESDLAMASNACLNINVEEEACPLGLAPTTSTTVSLALSDAVAMALLNKKGFKEENFAEFHPGGSLGRRLLTRVKDVMHQGEGLPLVNPEASFKEVVSIMTSKEVRGVAGVVDISGKLLGIITDGDIRRNLDQSKDSLNETAQSMMSTSPKTILSTEMAQKALFLMEQFSIQSLFVLNPEDQRPEGILHLQDLLKAKIR